MVPVCDCRNRYRYRYRMLRGHYQRRPYRARTRTAPVPGGCPPARLRYTCAVTLWIVAAIVLILNLPFGYWRARVRKFSAQWILAIHLPVPIVIACRVFSGLGWHLATFPVMVAAFFCGQFLGGKLFLAAKPPDM